MEFPLRQCRRPPSSSPADTYTRYSAIPPYLSSRYQINPRKNESIHPLHRRWARTPIPLSHTEILTLGVFHVQQNTSQGHLKTPKPHSPSRRATTHSSSAPHSRHTPHQKITHISQTSSATTFPSGNGRTRARGVHLPVCGQLPVKLARNWRKKSCMVEGPGSVWECPRGSSF